MGIDINRDVPIPLQIQVKECLKSRISSSKFKPFDRIPSGNGFVYSLSVFPTILENVYSKN